MATFTLSYATVIIALLGIVAGYTAQAINTGSFLGVVTVPKTWLPYLTLAGTFLAAFVASIVAAPDKNAAAWVSAGIAGFIALGGNVTGITAHQHIATGKPANDNAVAPDDKKAA